MSFAYRQVASKDVFEPSVKFAGKLLFFVK
jgi:hypothetical protein